MKSLSKNTLISIILFTVSGSFLYAQEVNDSVLTGQNTDEEIVINIKMVKRFYAMYDSIVVIPWGEMLTGNFDDAKNYIAAYRNIDLNKVNNTDILSTLDEEAYKIKSGNIAEKEESTKSLAAITDLESNR